MMKGGKRFFDHLIVDRNRNPEIVRIITLVGAIACLAVFVESNIHYWFVNSKDYDLDKVGDFMDKFSQSFAWIIGSGALGIAARSVTDKQHDPDDRQEQPCAEGDKK